MKRLEPEGGGMWAGAAIMLAVAVVAANIPIGQPLESRPSPLSLDGAVANAVSKDNFNEPETLLTTPCDPPIDLRTSELCAAWKSADASRDDANWGLLAFCVGSLINLATLIGLYATFRETREATRLAKESLRADSRGWLSIRPTLIEKPYLGQTHLGVTGMYANVGARIDNRGNSPATNVEFIAEIHLQAPDKPPREYLMLDLARRMRERHVFQGEAVFQGDGIDASHMVFLPLSEIEKMANPLGGFIPAIVGCVNYRTPHVEGVCQTYFWHSLVKVSSSGEAFIIDVDPDKWGTINIQIAAPGVVFAN